MKMASANGQLTSLSQKDETHENIKELQTREILEKTHQTLDGIGDVLPTETDQIEEGDGGCLPKKTDQIVEEDNGYIQVLPDQTNTYITIIKGSIHLSYIYYYYLFT